MADPNTVRRIARLAEVGDGDRVVEIGPGLGSLTLALAETGAEVTAVELDRHLLPALREVVEPHGVRIVQGDALRLDWDDVLGPPDPARPWVLVANLPYNVATPLVLDLLADVPAIARMLVMVQREVGERLAARPGNKAYGIPSVKVAYRADAEVVGRVPPTVFVPPPRVDSALVRITRLPSPRVEADPEVLFRLVQAGFGQRRKMLRRSLAGLVDADGFALADVRPEARAEELDVADWARLAGCGRVTGLTAGPASPSPAVVPAPAKLTVSLHVTGVRDDGYHLIDAEMVSLDLADELTFTERPGGAGSRSVALTASARSTPTTTSSSGRCPRWGAMPTWSCVDGSPPEAGWGAGRQTRRRSCAGRAPTTSRPRRGSEPTCRSASRRPGAGHGDRRDPGAAAVRGPHLHPGHAPVRLLDAGGVRGMGRPRRADGRRAQRPRARRPRGRAADGGLPRRVRRGDRPDAAAGGLGLDLVRARRVPWRGPHRGAHRPGVLVAASPTGAGTRNERPVGRGARAGMRLDVAPGRLLAGCAALPAGALQHLLVLLLAHPLAALLDERAHEGCNPSGASPCPPTWAGAAVRHAAGTVSGILRG